MADLEDTLDKIYDDLKQLRDEIKLKVHLGSMELRDQWQELENDWTNWTHHVAQELQAKGEDLEAEIREAGGEDLRKVEIKTKLAISKLKQGFEEVSSKLKD